MTPEQWATYQGVYDALTIGTLHVGPLTVQVRRGWRYWEQWSPLVGRIRDWGGLPGLTVVWVGPLHLWWSRVESARATGR